MNRKIFIPALIIALCTGLSFSGCDDDSTSQTPPNTPSKPEPEKPEPEPEKPEPEPEKPDTPTVPNTPDGSPCQVLDSDGDGIANEFECLQGTVETGVDCEDTDGDGTPDYIDTDSDNDTIPDSIEANAEGQCIRAIEDANDADYDDTPDFRDTDSDDNGIPDKTECGADPNHPVDTDGDTTPDYIDADNDEDGISDLDEIIGLGKTDNGRFAGDCDGDSQPDEVGSADHPVDCDGDNVPDYMDRDSDGDGVDDGEEYNFISGQYYARYSKDADNNGIDDKTECAGTLNEYGLMRLCVNSDDDPVLDFIDIDNDGDFLTDVYEIEHGSSPNAVDTDNDDVDDYVEIAAGTDPANAEDNPPAHGNFVFIAPYEKNITPDKQSLSFETAVQSIDLFFIMDNTESMDAETKALADKLTKEIIPVLQCSDLGKDCENNNDCSALQNSICSEKGRCIRSPSYGGGCFDNIESGVGFYSAIDTFWVGSHISGDHQKTENALKARFKTLTTTDPENYTEFCSSGNMEPPFQMPICAVLGTEKYEYVQYCYDKGTNYCRTAPETYVGCGYNSKCKMNCSTNKSRIGCAGFRNDAVRIVLEAFDEEQCNLNAGSEERCKLFEKNIGQILKKYMVRYVGLWGTYNNVPQRTNAEIMSLSINNSADYAYGAQDGAITFQATTAVQQIAKQMPLNITAEVNDVTPDASKLIKGLKLNVSGDTIQGHVCNAIDKSKIIEGDIDSISSLLPGTTLCYDVIPVETQSVFPSTNEPQLIRARIRVMGDGSTLNSGIAYFVVPPKRPDIIN